MTNKKLKIVADENLALTDYFFDEVADIDYMAGRGITAADISTTDALLIRSVTKVNAALLADSPVQFIGSATIGTDHVDLDLLKQKGISFANAPGCNAQAVAEYVITAILTLQPQLVLAGKTMCLGIVGLGNVGRRLAILARRLDWRVLAYDPFVRLDTFKGFAFDQTGGKQSGIEQLSFEQVLAQSDALSLHVPLTKNQPHATYHLMDAAALAQLKPHCMLINSARGEVVSEQALLADIATSKRQVVLDVFEHEPKISQQLLNQLALATPHIAGYSLEGKARGTQMIYQAFCQHYDLTASKQFASQLPQMAQLFKSDQTLAHQLLPLLPQLYPIQADDQALRGCVNQSGFVDGQDFDHLRKTYPLRREWAAYGDQNN